MTQIASIPAPALAPSNGAEFAAWLQAIGVIAQAVIAVVAIYFAYKAIRSNHNSLFLRTVIDTLQEATAKARTVRASYLSMFKPFPDVQAKTEARTRWLEAREGVGNTLAEMQQLLPEIGPARAAWRNVEAREDTHARTDALALNDPAAIAMATKQYDEMHQAFLRTLGKILKALR